MKTTTNPEIDFIACGALKAPPKQTTIFTDNFGTDKCGDCSRHLGNGGTCCTNADLTACEKAAQL